MGDFAFSFWLEEIRAKSINAHKTGMLFQIADFSAPAFYLVIFDKKIVVAPQRPLPEGLLRSWTCRKNN